MKEGIHPKYFDVDARCACGATWKTRSTKPELHLEICSNCHPFFTGRQKLIDTEGRVERFTKKFGAQTSESRKKAAKAKKEGRVGHALAERSSSTRPAASGLKAAIFSVRHCRRRSADAPSSCSIRPADGGMASSRAGRVASHRARARMSSRPGDREPVLVVDGERLAGLTSDVRRAARRLENGPPAVSRPLVPRDRRAAGQRSAERDSERQRPAPPAPSFHRAAEPPLSRTAAAFSTTSRMFDQPARE